MNVVDQSQDEPVELHPDLKAYMEACPRLGHMIRHPLIYSVPYFDSPMYNDHLNKRYEFCKQKLEESFRTENFGMFVFTHERPHRLAALHRVQPLMEQEDFDKLMFEVYVDSENIWQNYDEWIDLLEPLAGEDPWKTLHELPDGPFSIYRGGSKTGISWTLDEEKAKWFANRWKHNEPVWHAVVERGDCIGYYNGRGEQEVIVLPSEIRDKVELSSLDRMPPR